MFTRSAVAIIAALAVTALAHADEMPSQLVKDLIKTEHENCKTSTGYDKNFVLLRDVDGDGRKDVILDYSEALCGGEPAPYCDDQGCLLKVYRASKGGGYAKAFDAKVRAWKLDESGASAVLIIDGTPFGK